jgi:hypothetical protein
MKPQIMGLRVASIVFGLMMLAQLARLLLRPEVIIQGHLLPLWPSALAVLFLGILCVWLWSLSTPRPDQSTGQKYG